VKLNLGCGKDIREDCYNIDIRPLPKVMQADVCNLPFRDESVDEVLALDIYEHISYLKSQDLLNHWVSKLKSGGLLILQAPCLDKIIEYFLTATNPGMIETGIACLFGSQDYKENTHLTVCQTTLMQSYLKKAGIKGMIKMNFDGVNVIWRCIK